MTQKLSSFLYRYGLWPTDSNRKSFILPVGRMIYGGSFNPVHQGHLDIIQHIIEKGIARSVIVVPANASPFKPNLYLPNRKYRLEMLKLAIASLPNKVQKRVTVSAVELDRPALSYTADTLRELNADRQTGLCIGADSFTEFEQWKEVDFILSRVPLYVVYRDGTKEQELIETKQRLIGFFPVAQIHFIPFTPASCSSTQLREKLQSMASFSELQKCLPQSVFSYLSSHQLYSTTENQAIVNESIDNDLELTSNSMDDVNRKIEIVIADITTLKVDAIVNAANTSLLGGGGVDGAIHYAAGPELLDECRSIGSCPIGGARLTKGYRLPAKFVIHSVGPVWRGDVSNQSTLLASCYFESLQLADQNQFKSIAFPNISTGVYGYPREEAAIIALKSIRDYLAITKLTSIQRVILCCYDAESAAIYRRLMV